MVALELYVDQYSVRTMEKCRKDIPNHRRYTSSKRENLQTIKDETNACTKERERNKQTGKNNHSAYPTS